MTMIQRLKIDLASGRAQHLVYLIHVWVCVPLLVYWAFDTKVERIMGASSAFGLRVVTATAVVYLLIRVWLAAKDPPWLKWWYVFPPIDVALITLILCITRLGPMSNIALLFFLPIVQASGSLNIRWAACVGLMVVLGTVVATLVPDIVVQTIPKTFAQLIHDDPLSVAFRILFMIVISSLMTYQAMIAAGYRERMGVEADRNRIAMEMHDGVQGHLITIASQLELISRIAPSDGVKAAEIAQEGREGARAAADELRFLVQRLRNPALESGFIAALSQYANNICERNNIRLVFEVKGTRSPMSPEVENALFRIAQESLSNVVKHAEAQSVAITVEFEDGSARLVVIDDGDGFDPDAATEGIGLEGMRKRATVNGGNLTIESKPRAGTRIDAAFKIEAHHA